MSAIHSDAALLNEYPDALETEDDVFAALMTDPEEGDDAAKPQPSKKKVDEKKTEETDDDDTNETDEDAEEPSDEEEEGEDDEGTEDEQDEETEEDEGSKKKFADDDDETYVKVKEGDQEHEVKVSDLKRLWGQEASLTRKSQEVSDLKKQYDDGHAKNIAAYDVLLKKATSRADSFRNLPWTQLMKDPNVPAEQLAELQKEAQSALEEEAFLKNEIDGFMKKVADDQGKERAKSARECIKVLTDPKTGIKGWNEAMYNDIRTFATEQGLNKDMVNSLTDPGAFKILHMAMQFSRGKTKVVTKKVNKTPTRIVKNSASAPAARSSSKTVVAQQAVKKATKSGTMEDAVNAFEALFGDE